jgi:hypothetical protein
MNISQALIVGIVLSVLCTIVLMLTIGLMITKLRIFIGKNGTKYSKDGIDSTLIWPQIAVAVFALIFSLMVLIVYSLELSGSFPVANCKPVVEVMLVIFILAKVGIFHFLIQKAQVVDSSISSRKFVFWILYVLVLIYAVILIYAGTELEVSQTADENGVQHCAYTNPTFTVRYGWDTEILVSIGCFGVFLKPIISLARWKENHDVEAQKRKQAMKKVIIASFAFVCVCLISSMIFYGIITLYWDQSQPYTGLIISSSVIQLDLIVGLATLMLTTKTVWFETYASHSHSYQHHQENKKSGIPQGGTSTSDQITPAQVQAIIIHEIR